MQSTTTPLLSTSHTYADVKEGDILFFSAPPDPVPFIQAQMNKQWWLSCWASLFCCSEDYKKVHVAICINILINGDAEVAHVTGEGYKKKLLKEVYRANERQIDVLRPKDAKFIAALKTVAAKDQTVTWSGKSYDQSLACCSSSASTDPERNSDGFSTETSCSQYVAEVVTTAAAKSGCKEYTLSNSNHSVMALWQHFNASKLYDDHVEVKAESALSKKYIFLSAK